MLTTGRFCAGPLTLRMPNSPGTDRTRAPTVTVNRETLKVGSVKRFRVSLGVVGVFGGLRFFSVIERTYQAICHE